MKDDAVTVYPKEEFPHSIIPLKIDQLHREVTLHSSAVIKGNIFAHKVTIYSGSPDELGPTRIQGYVYGKEIIDIHSFTLIEGAVVTDGEVFVGNVNKADQAIPKGHVRILVPILAGKDIAIFNDSTIYGDVVSKTGNIKIGENCQIYGTILGNIVNIGANSFIGRAIAIKALNINHHVTALDPIVRCEQGKINFSSDVKWLRCLNASDVSDSQPSKKK